MLHHVASDIVNFKLVFLGDTIEGFKSELVEFHLSSQQLYTIIQSLTSPDIPKTPYPQSFILFPYDNFWEIK